MLEQLMNGAVSVENGRVTINNEAALAGPEMDALVRSAVFGDEDTRDNARWLIWEIGQAVGVVPSSIHDLYMARGRGETRGYTVGALPGARYSMRACGLADATCCTHSSSERLPPL